MTKSEALVQEQGKPPFQISLGSYYDGSSRAVVRIKISDDASTAHAPAVVVLVIDESGSMGSAAVCHDDSDGSSGLTQLDVVKHASRTIIESLSTQDSLAVVAFSTEARVVLPITKMTPSNKNLASKSIDSLRPTASTNLYDGLNVGLELLRSASLKPHDNANIMLLTDGMPNVSPPRGELATLQRYLDTNPHLRSVRISTFGFGYSLKSRLLSTIATEGRSIYAFIPDSSFVGTIFVNSMANLLSAATSKEVTLKLEASKGIMLKDCLSGHSCTKTSWGLSISLPSLIYGQEVDIVIALETPSKSLDPFHTTLTFLNGVEQKLETSTDLVDPFDAEYAIIRKALVRSMLIQFIKAAEGKTELEEKTNREITNARQLLEETKRRVKIITDTACPPDVAAILEDLNGQVTEAYSEADFYKRWGSHYVLSLLGAHILQQCINFKDPGIQEYATKKFTALRDASEAIFIKLPPPKPSRVARTPVASMRTYYDHSAPCFAYGNVKLADGRQIDVSEVKPGDLVQCDNNSFARVCYIVETPCREGMQELVVLEDGVSVTPWHPIRLPGGEWKFPCSIKDATLQPCKMVYSFALEAGKSSMRIGKYDGISLGHRLRGNPIIEHEFLGTDRVLQVLATFTRMKNNGGVVRLDAQFPVVRNSESGRICGFLRDMSVASENDAWKSALVEKSSLLSVN